MKIPEQITVPFGEEGQKRDIPQTGDVTDVLASFQYGFPPRTMSSESDAVPPSGQDMNAILYLLNTIAQYAQAGGVYPYSAQFAQAIGGYPVGAMVREAAGSRCWRNTVANNTSDPDNGGAGWEADSNAEMVGATASAAGHAGIVPAPAAGEQDSVLKGDGTWGSIASRNIGETVFSLLPLNDEGLHLLDGSFLPKGGIYDAFVERIGEIREGFAEHEVVGETYAPYYATDHISFTITDSNGSELDTSDLINGNEIVVSDWSTYWVDLDFGQYTQVYNYYLSAGAESIEPTSLVDSDTPAVMALDGEGDSSSYPTAWTLYGSNDGGSTWDVLDERTGQAFSDRTIGKFYYPENPGFYKKYRIVFHDGQYKNGSLYGFGMYIYDVETTYAQGLFYTEDQWQACVEKYGVCGKFVYTDEGVRLPKITGFVEGTLDANALGDLVEAGLPNITGLIGSDEFPSLAGAYSSGAFYATSSSAGQNTATGSSTMSMDINFDASRSNSIYGNSSTVQPQAIKGYLYMVVATSAKTDVQVNLDNVATDLNGKADVGLSNIASTAASNLNAHGIRTVVQTYSNGTNWYRKWSDGWIEQGGYHAAGTAVTVTLLIPFDGTGYCVQLTGIANVDSYSPVFTSRTTTTFLVRSAGAGSKPGVWSACGYKG